MCLKEITHSSSKIICRINGESHIYTYIDQKAYGSKGITIERLFISGMYSHSRKKSCSIEIAIHQRLNELKEKGAEEIIASFEGERIE
jgi:hypothetical protein